jgi:hypothetical protein
MSDAARVGLCLACRHAARVTGARSTFYLCRRAATDPRFQKYPRLPVLACPGFDRLDASPGEDRDAPSAIDEHGPSPVEPDDERRDPPVEDE